MQQPIQEGDTMNQAFKELMKRPNLTQAEADYQSMFQTIRERLITEVGVPDWVPGREPITGSACGGLVSKLEDAKMRMCNAGISPGNLPGAKWDQAVRIVTEIAQQHGFGSPTVVVNSPSDHEVSYRNAYHGELLFGTGANTILIGSTGCHLTEEAHQRGTPAPPKKY